MYQAFPLILLHKTEYHSAKTHLNFVFTFRLHCFVGANIGLWLD